MPLSRVIQFATKLNDKGKQSYNRRGLRHTHNNTKPPNWHHHQPNKVSEWNICPPQFWLAPNIVLYLKGASIITYLKQFNNVDVVLHTHTSDDDFHRWAFFVNLWRGSGLQNQRLSMMVWPLRWGHLTDPFCKQEQWLVCYVIHYSFFFLHFSNSRVMFTDRVELKNCKHCLFYSSTSPSLFSAPHPRRTVTLASDSKILISRIGPWENIFAEILLMGMAILQK